MSVVEFEEKTLRKHTKRKPREIYKNKDYVFSISKYGDCFDRYWNFEFRYHEKHRDLDIPSMYMKRTDVIAHRTSLPHGEKSKAVREFWTDCEIVIEMSVKVKLRIRWKQVISPFLTDNTYKMQILDVNEIGLLDRCM